MPASPEPPAAWWRRWPPDRSEPLNSAIDQARLASASGRYVAMGLGSLGALVTATTAMGRLQRSLNRIYGIERDRPTGEKYRLALRLALTAGVLMVVAFGAIALGNSIGHSIDDSALSYVSGVVRFPAGLVLMVGAMAVLLRWCPHRRQPGWPWLMSGAGIGVALLGCRHGRPEHRLRGDVIVR